MATDLPVNQSEHDLLTDTLPGMPHIDGFEMMCLLGAGGMSTVYKARQIALDRLVAIKVMNASLMHDRASIQRFLSEARLSTKLNHPNIATVIACGSAESKPFLVMELLAGKTLKQLLRERGTLRLHEIKQIFVQVCAGLSHAHQHGIVHRDLKPANIMLIEEDGGTRVKILDFGIAKVIQEENNRCQKLTRTGQVVGSPVYMSPEQFTNGVVDARSDIYSIGCMLFEALSGKTPFCGETPLQLATMHVMNETPVLEAEKPLRDLVAKAMAKQPAQRYADAQQLADALLSIDKAVGTAVSGATIMQAIQRGLRKFRPRGAALTAAAAALLLVACLVPALFIQTHDPRLSRAESLIKQGDYVAAFEILRPLSGAVLNESDANAWIDDMLAVAVMESEDALPNKKFHLQEQWNAQRLISRMAAEPNDNHPSTAQHYKALFINAKLQNAPGGRFHLIKDVDVSNLDPAMQEYCLSIKDQLHAEALMTDQPRDVSEPDRLFHEAVRHARLSGNTGRAISCLISAADLFFSQQHAGQAKACMDEAYTLFDAGVRSVDLETAAAVLRLARQSAAQDTAFYNLPRARKALNCAKNIYAVTGSSKHGKASTAIAEGVIELNGGNAAAAYQAFARAISIEPPAYDLWIATAGAAMAMDKLGKSTDAMQTLEGLEATLKACDVAFYKRRDLVVESPLVLANLYVKAGRTADALPLYEEWFRNAPRRPRMDSVVSEAQINYLRLKPQ